MSTAAERSADQSTRDEAFRTFFVEQFPVLAGYCTSLVTDPELGEDLAQEALVRTWGRWVAVRQPRAYAYLVATNLARKHWQDTARRQTVLDDTSATVGDTADGLALRDLVDRLPDRLRVPVLLHYYADLPLADVARVLHRPTGTVKQRLHEARQRLADQYGPAS